MLLYTYFQKSKQVTRREYDDMLQDKVVYLNDVLVEDFKVEVKIWDTILIKLPKQGEFVETVKYLPWFAPKLVLFNKPKWYVCSKDDQHNKIIYELLPKSRLNDFWYIGRLDKYSTGLLLLTNESKLVDYYENPFHDVHKVYEVTIDKPLRSNDIKKMRKWMYVTSEGEQVEEQDSVTTDFLKCVSVSYKRIHDKHYAVITLNEWKNRHIRRLLWALWYKISRLHRIKVGKWHINTIKPGKRKMEKISLKKLQENKRSKPWMT